MREHPLDNWSETRTPRVRTRYSFGTCAHLAVLPEAQLSSWPVLLLSLKGFHFGSFSLHTKGQNYKENFGYLLLMICGHDLLLVTQTCLTFLLFSYCGLTTVNVCCVFFQVSLRSVIHM